MKGSTCCAAAGTGTADTSDLDSESKKMLVFE